ncbi:MAG: BatD family protein [Planctomycetaceae bacterium]|jgi:hypothetical protein|nr:BatD family protein [Planctomycetaceae bacterium]
MKIIVSKLCFSFDRFFITKTILFLTLLLVSSLTSWADLSMTTAIDRANIYKGERITYHIILTDSKQIDSSIEPDLSNYTDFDIRTLPKQMSNNSGNSVQVIINGQVVRQESSTQSRSIFTYELTPKREGQLIIPAPTVFSNGHKIAPNSAKVLDKSATCNADGSFPITVRSPDEQDIVKMRIETDRRRLYPFQPFQITLVVQVKSLPPAVLQANTSPIAVLREPPNIKIDWANDNSLQKGLRPALPLNEWLYSIRAPRSQKGFAINEYATRGIDFDDDLFGPGTSGGFGNIMNEMIRGRLLQFAPTPKEIVTNNANGTKITYWEYRFTRKFIAEELGNYNFDAILKGNFVVENKNSREGASLQRIYAIAPEVLVNVVDVPLTNRPENYVGAFGKFDLITDIQPRKAKRGEPMTLTLKLIGEGSTGNVTPPDLTTNQEVTNNFKIHSPTEEGDNNSCTFTYPIRATQSGTIVFPSLPISYFDVQSEQFVTLNSKPISLEITDSEQLNGEFSFSKNNSAINNFERSEHGLLANMTENSDIVNQSVNYSRWIMLNIILTLTYLSFQLILFLRCRLGADPQRRRRLGAISRIKTRFNRIQQNLKNNNLPEAVIQYGNELQNSLFGYIADLSCVSEHGMTTKDAYSKYIELGGEKEQAELLRKVLEILDSAKYGGLDLKSLDDLIISIENILAHPINIKDISVVSG